MTRIDLDAARKARAETLGEPLVVVFGGEEFTLPVEKPFDFAMYLARGYIYEAVEALLSPDDVTRFWRRDKPPSERPATPDVAALLDAVADHFGTSDPGESAASPSLSNGTSGS